MTIRRPEGLEHAPEHVILAERRRHTSAQPDANEPVAGRAGRWTGLGRDCQVAIPAGADAPQAVAEANERVKARREGLLRATDDANAARANVEHAGLIDQQAAVAAAAADKAAPKPSAPAAEAKLLELQRRANAHEQALALAQGELLDRIVEVKPQWVGQLHEQRERKRVAVVELLHELGDQLDGLDEIDQLILGLDDVQGGSVLGVRLADHPEQAATRRAQREQAIAAASAPGNRIGDYDPRTLPADDLLAAIAGSKLAPPAPPIEGVHAADVPYGESPTAAVAANEYGRAAWGE